VYVTFNTFKKRSELKTTCRCMVSKFTNFRRPIGRIHTTFSTLCDTNATPQKVLIEDDNEDRFHFYCLHQYIHIRLNNKHETTQSISFSAILISVSPFMFTENDSFSHSTGSFLLFPNDKLQA